MLLSPLPESNHSEKVKVLKGALTRANSHQNTR
jgi:hypothetical protein